MPPCLYNTHHIEAVQSARKEGCVVGIRVARYELSRWQRPKNQGQHDKRVLGMKPDLLSDTFDILRPDSSEACGRALRSFILQNQIIPPSCTASEVSPCAPLWWDGWRTRQNIDVAMLLMAIRNCPAKCELRQIAHCNSGT